MFYTMKDLDQEFWRQVKILAATREISIKALIIELLTKEIERNQRNG